MKDLSISTKEEYLHQRKTLITTERALRRDTRRIQTRTALEKEADEIVRRIRAEEAETVWKKEYEGIIHPFPGMEFLTGKSIIESTQIFKILSKMPKGALLHIHLAATVDIKVLLSLTLKQPAMHIRVSELLTSKNINSVVAEFSALPSSLWNFIGPSLTSAEYVPNTWVNVKKAREIFGLEVGGEKGFDEWSINSMTLKPAEAYGTHNTVDKIWEKFESTFMVSSGIIRFLPILTEYIRLFIWGAIEDGIMYMEPRFDFFVGQSMLGADGHTKISHSEFLLAYEDIIRDIKNELKKQGRENKFIGARIIYSIIKIQLPPENLYWYLDDCIELKKQFPNLVAGFDLVGYENKARPLIDYIEPLLYFKKRQATEGLDIPFIFHAGETLGDGDAPDCNVYDAILLGTKRIGHGFSLTKHPKLVEMCREQNIAVEICPISNEVLRLTSSMPMHPLPILLNSGVPIALSSDGPSVFGNMGVTYDFFQVLVSSEISGLTTLGVLARDSIEFSSMTTEEKSEAVSHWEDQWNLFLEDVAKEYHRYK